MPSEQPLVSIDLTAEYQQNLRALSKRYRNIRSDTQVVIEQLQTGNSIGDRIANIGQNYTIYKVRVRNSNIQKGKSAGYKSPTSVLLLTIYSKSDREDIDANEIRAIITEFYEECCLCH
ncbi:type II toxin-antitoxin system RelE/ParE family toxin [Gloeocapsopsis crepidinum LEGE 06123]|uniref:Type II toxin-antitoxin system RelE/ParE family toxin n=1 Tax=Gloeocapsopsis crepidinum LEGE 06123 TaxID=588587 RepID=A0ABR9UZH8_9CHRO|nr:type II toxin-antitoxin system RelE/ParE family toxin [Gloeocapsopsis crepidinum]MBE9193725.1 type II toxin-antitoxin system RelE/ParE family toxin [Gloeocapsopsis crepidinum LEGE 06123]